MDNRRKFMQRAAILVSAILLVLASSSSLYGQSERARIIGTVTDPQGAVVPGATVIVTNAATGVASKATTNQDGQYQAPELPIGAYKVKVARQGFKTIETISYTLDINQTLRVDVSLPIGATNEVVTVEGTAATIDTVNPTLGSTVPESEIHNAPLNGRNALDLALLQPGVLPADNPGNGGTTSANTAFSISGGRNDSNTFLLDGGINNVLISNGVVYNPNPDAIEEFKVLTNNFSAEYGRSSGGIITVVTKSGTNDFHGSAFDYNRNTDYNANSFFSNSQGLPRDILKRNQYGGTFGGPIKKDKLFFFVAYQGQRQTQLVPSGNIAVFTPQELQGNFSNSPNQSAVASFLQANPFFQSNSALAAQGIIDPTKFDPVAQAYLKAGLIPSATSGQESFQSPASDNRDEISGKFDWEITEKDRLNATLGRNKTSLLVPGPAGIPGFDANTTESQEFLNVAYTRILAPSMLNEFRATAQRSNRLQASPATTSLPTASQLGVGITPSNPTGPPRIDFPNQGLLVGFSIQGPSNLIDNTFAYSDTLSWTRGKHTMKFGGSFSSYQDNQVFDFIVNGQFQFFGSSGAGDAFANFLVGDPATFSQGAAAPSNIRTKATYIFGQDEWHLANNVVFTYGLRYEYSSPKYDTQGRTYDIIPGQQSTVFPGAPVGLAFPGDRGAPTGVNFPDKTNFAPRAGFAWQPFKDSKTSIRGGFGVFYDILKAEDNFQFNGQPPFAPGGGFQNPTLPTATSSGFNFLSDPYGSTNSPNPFLGFTHNANLLQEFGTFSSIKAGATIVDPHIRTPYTYQYNLAFEQELARKVSMTMAYVGSSSHGLTGLVDINPFDPATLQNTNPQRFLNETAGNFPAQTDPNGSLPPGFNPNVPGGSFGQQQEFRNVSNANYNALQLSLRQQSRSVPILGTMYYTLGYTWAHSIDGASGFRNNTSTVPFFNPNLFRASSDFDIRHSLVFSGGWDLPFNRGPKRLVKGWSIYPLVSWRSGFPFSVLGGLFTADNAPGPSGAGDAGLAYGNLNGPIGYLNPHASQTLGGQTGFFFFNPASFDNNVTSGYGTAPRNVLRGPGRTNMDLSLVKTTPLYGERVHLELHVDAFNIFNHTQFQNLDNNAGDIGFTFGQALTAYDPRILQLAARITF